VSVRQGLLAILGEGDCYGYQLRSEYARRTGAAPTNVGQIYTTLERLERDGLVARRGADEHGHVYWAITDAGRAEAGRWFAEPEVRRSRDELAHKLALALTLPGVDAAAVIGAHAAAAARHLERMTRDAAAPADDASRVVRAAELAHAHAEVQWLQALAADPTAANVYGLAEERPRRGRPAQAG
jgi:DNA-binding PadR family transcriptional regulator